MDSSDIKCSFLNNFTMTNTSTHSGETIPQSVQVVYMCFLATCLIVGVPGNLLVAAVYGYHDSKSTTDWFILFAAIFDSFVCCLEAPFFLSFETGSWKIYTSDSLCRIFSWTSQSLTLSSCVLLCLIAVDRFKKICTPVNPSMTPKAAKYASGLCLLVSVFLSLPVIILYGNNSQGDCKVLDKYEKSLWVGLYYTIFFTVFVVMFFLVVVSYFMVARRLRHRFNVHKIPCESMSETISDSIKHTVHELIPNASTSNTPTPPMITILITDFSVEDNVESHSQTPSPSTCRTCCSNSKKPDKSQNTNSVSPLYDRFLLQVPQMWPIPDIERPTGPPYSTDMFTASSFQIFSKDNSTNKNDRKQSTCSENTVTLLLFTITLIFILSWILPWYIFLFKFYSPAKCPERQLTAAMIRYGPQMYLLNHFSNPIVYSLMSRSFRDNVRSFGEKVMSFFTVVRF